MFHYLADSDYALHLLTPPDLKVVIEMIMIEKDKEHRKKCPFTCEL